MKLEAISHRNVLTDCYAYNDRDIVIHLRTGKDVTAVTLIHGDPFAGGCMGVKAWSGVPTAMEQSLELARHQLWTIRVSPRYKREQYYFEITDGIETVLLLEDDFYSPETAFLPGRVPQYFKFPWLNAVDVCSVPQWVSDMVWYQIMPDRFCRGNMAQKRMPLKDWEDTAQIRFDDFYGGDLPGITEKLPYLKELGITGIYMTPIFLSDSNHKYNTFDYETIDPDFGTEEDMIRLVETAHSLGIRVMVDAVFNHCGLQFAPWQDVMEKGAASPYYDWFFVHTDPLPRIPDSTADGRYYSFAFESYMPKLNTGNPAVADYCIARCRHWVERWQVDGIRFDVGNEVSHRFLKQLNRELKALKPDLFLLGEIWGDSVQWLQGDEYDSVMNYSFIHSLQNFWLDKGMDSRELMFALNRCLSLYPEQVNSVLFNFLDTHDTPRAIHRCGNPDSFFQQLVVLMTTQGSPCMYYGTEIALEGGDDPDNRRPMPWKRLESGQCEETLTQVKALIRLRLDNPQLRSHAMHWHHDPAHPRLISYTRGTDQPLQIFLNAGDHSVPVETGAILFARVYENGILQPGGCLITA